MSAESPLPAGWSSPIGSAQSKDIRPAVEIDERRPPVDPGRLRCERVLDFLTCADWAPSNMVGANADGDRGLVYVAPGGWAHALSRGGTTADASAVFAGLSRFVHGRRCLGSGGLGCCRCSMRSMSGCDSRSWPQGDGSKWRHLCGGGVSL